MISDSELKDIVIEAIVGALMVEPEEVTPSARVFVELGAESIDMLDIQFRLEKRLGIKVQLDKALSPADLKTDEKGQLTPESIAAVKARFPSLIVDGNNPIMGVGGLKDLLTVGAIMDYLKPKLLELPS